MKKRYSWLVLVTILYFASAFVHIGLSLLVLVCMILPFILVWKNRKKTWCIRWCPRSYWLDAVGRWGRQARAPRKLVSSRFRNAVLTYFGINLFFVTLSSVMVAIGRMAPMDYIRLFMFIPTYLRLPQLVVIEAFPPVLLHFSYRMYSIMVSSTLVGTVLGLLFKPRTWCAICPISNLSSRMLKNLEKKEGSGGFE